jgi:dolichol kinase
MLISGRKHYDHGRSGEYSVTRGDKALPRRLWHIFGGLSVPLSSLRAPQDVFLASLFSITVAAVALDVVRQRSPGVNRRFILIFAPLLREGEGSGFTASSYFLLAAFTVFLLCPASVAALAMVFAAVGDPVAGIVGERWGKLRIRASEGARAAFRLELVQGRLPAAGEKSVEGSVACLLASLVSGMALAVVTGMPLWVVVVGAASATMAELFSLSVNDNLSAPLVSAGVITVLQSLVL